MKKILLGVVSILLVGGRTTTYAMGPIQSQVRQLEAESELSDSTIYTNITYRPVRQILESQCSDASLRQAYQISNVARDLVSKRYGIDGSYLLTDTQQLYDLIARLQDRTRSYDDPKYCTTKYVLNALQLQLREIHLGYMEDTGLIDEFEGVNELDPIINGYDAKLGIIQSHIRAYRPALGQLGARIEPTILNPEFLKSLTAQQQFLTTTAQELMQAVIAQSMIDLKARKFLDQEEIDDLASKIQYEYTAACGIFHGKYEIRQTFRNDQLVGQSSNSLTLKINLCPSFFVIRDLPEIYTKIVTHELAHHIYYFSDDRVDQYEAICRDGETDRNGVCMSDDFVTPYAQTNSLEDYAEHFMHRFLDQDYHVTPVTTTKDQHFKALEQRVTSSQS